LRTWGFIWELDENTLGTPQKTFNKGCVSHTVALPFTFKKYLKAKEEELWKFKYFTMQKYNLQKKNPLKETKILQDHIITL
jgi:hypothetical protein